MGKYATSYNINNKMLTLVADIMEEVGKLSDPHSNHSLITGGVKIDLPDPYNEEGYASYFPKEKKIGDDAKRLLSWSKKQEKKVHPLFSGHTCRLSPCVCLYPFISDIRKRNQKTRESLCRF